jgi:UDP-glucose 6-dehydrogenase
MLNFDANVLKENEMKNQSAIDGLEKLIGQLKGLHVEITNLAKKSPNDAVNVFKLKLINKVIENGNNVLGKEYRPFEDFVKFDLDDVPTTSDVAMVLNQYTQEAERYRSDNVTYDHGHWVYVVDGQPTDIRSAPPSRIGEK